MVYPFFNQTFNVSQLPKVFYVKGFVVSNAARDVTFRAEYDDGDGFVCEGRSQADGAGAQAEVAAVYERSRLERDGAVDVRSAKRGQRTL